MHCHYLRSHLSCWVAPATIVSILGVTSAAQAAQLFATEVVYYDSNGTFSQSQIDSQYYRTEQTPNGLPKNIVA